MHAGIALTDTDWRWATWRDLPPRARPAAPPYDFEACRDRFAKKVKLPRHGLSWDFSRVELSPGMSAEEARFWLAMMLKFERDRAPSDVAAKLKRPKLDRPSIDSVLRRLKNVNYPPSELPLLLPLAMSMTDATEILLRYVPRLDGHHPGGAMFHGFREHVAPYWTKAERAALAKKIAADVTPGGFPTDVYDAPSGPYLAAVLVGLHKQLEEVVSSIPDNRYSTIKSWSSDAYQIPQFLAFGLRDPERVTHHVRRMKLPLREPIFVRGWLAHTETSALDDVAEAIVATKAKPLACELAKVLALVDDPANVGPMIEVLTRSKASEVAISWLERNRAVALPMLRSAAPKRGPLTQAALRRLEAGTAQKT